MAGAARRSRLVPVELLLSALAALVVALGVVGLVVLLVGALVAPLLDGELGGPRRRGAA